MKATVKKVQSIETEIDIAAFSFQLKSLEYMKVRCCDTHDVAASKWHSLFYQKLKHQSHH